MSEGNRNKRLSAVLMADIAGYTKLVERDTHPALDAHRRRLIATSTKDVGLWSETGSLAKQPTLPKSANFQHSSEHKPFEAARLTVP